MLWKDFYVIWWYFLPKIICANSIMQKSLNSRNWELSDLPHVPFTTICRSANFTSIKFTHAKWSWIQWFIFGNTQKNNICSIVQRFPTTAKKMIFIIGYMAKQHTILSSRFLIWVSKEDQKHRVIKYRVYYLLIYRIFEAWVVCCRSNNLGSNTISWWLRSLAVSKRW